MVPDFLLRCREFVEDTYPRFPLPRVEGGWLHDQRYGSKVQTRPRLRRSISSGDTNKPACVRGGRACWRFHRVLNAGYDLNLNQDFQFVFSLFCFHLWPVHERSTNSD